MRNATQAGNKGQRQPTGKEEGRWRSSGGGICTININAQRVGHYIMLSHKYLSEEVSVLLKTKSQSVTPSPVPPINQEQDTKIQQLRIRPLGKNKSFTIMVQTHLVILLKTVDLHSLMMFSRLWFINSDYSFILSEIIYIILTIPYYFYRLFL